MSIIEPFPDDVLGLALRNLLTPLLNDQKFRKKVIGLKKKVIVLELKDVYSITLTFNDGDILIEYGAKPKYHLGIIVTLEAFVGIAEGKIGLVGAFLKGMIKAKKIYRVFTILKFKSIFFPAIKSANKNAILEGVINVL